MTRLGSILAALAALAAVGYLAAMVVVGAMPVQRQLVRFEAKGVLTLDPDAVRRVTVTRDGQAVTLVRTGKNAWSTEAGAAVTAAAAARLDTALKILHRSGPVREIEAGELGGVDTRPFGLDQPVLTVAVFADPADPALSARFGAINPEGILQYMRLDGSQRVYLMSRFVAAEWVAALEEIAKP